MPKETQRFRKKHVSANDNVRSDDNADIAPFQQLDTVVLSIARLIGRQLARQQFTTREAANDNGRAEAEPGHLESTSDTDRRDDE